MRDHRLCEARSLPPRRGEGPHRPVLCITADSHPLRQSHHPRVCDPTAQRRSGRLREAARLLVQLPPQLVRSLYVTIEPCIMCAGGHHPTRLTPRLRADDPKGRRCALRFEILLATAPLIIQVKSRRRPPPPRLCGIIQSFFAALRTSACFSLRTSHFRRRRLHRQ